MTSTMPHPVNRKNLKVLPDFRQARVLVVGDVNSTLACAVVAKKMCIRVAHVEAGLRSGDMTMPEETSSKAFMEKDRFKNTYQLQWN